jgi:uncharacterized protein (TIGR00251 family)
MNKHWYRWQKDTMLLCVHLQPGAKTSDVNGIQDNRLRIRIKSPPVDGRANRELVAMLARDFGAKKSQVRIKQRRIRPQ